MLRFLCGIKMLLILVSIFVFHQNCVFSFLQLSHFIVDSITEASLIYMCKELNLRNPIWLGLSFVTWIHFNCD